VPGAWRLIALSWDRSEVHRSNANSLVVTPPTNYRSGCASPLSILQRQLSIIADLQDLQGRYRYSDYCARRLAHDQTQTVLLSTPPTNYRSGCALPLSILQRQLSIIADSQDSQGRHRYSDYCARRLAHDLQSPSIKRKQSCC
jgi:hypothetical protein